MARASRARSVASMSSTTSRIAAAGALVAGALAARGPLLSWGASGPDRRRALPGDGLVPGEDTPRLESWPWTYRVQTFGRFRLTRHDETLVQRKGVQRRV